MDTPLEYRPSRFKGSPFVTRTGGMLLKIDRFSRLQGMAANLDQNIIPPLTAPRCVIAPIPIEKSVAVTYIFIGRARPDWVGPYFKRLRRVCELVSSLTRNQVPRKGLRVRVPCPPLGNLFKAHPKKSPSPSGRGWGRGQANVGID